MSEEPSDFTYSQKSLEPDSVFYTDGISEYPYGFSVMLSEDDETEGTFAYEEIAGEVHTTRLRNAADTEDWGVQVLYNSDDGLPTFRAWNTAGDAWWSFGTFAMPSHTHLSLSALTAPASAWPEGQDLSDYQPGFTVMPVLAGANWGPNTGEAGVVETFRYLTNGTQLFTQYSNGNRYSRGYASSAWSAWVALQ